MLDSLADHIDKILDRFYDFGVRSNWTETDDSPLVYERRWLSRHYGPDVYWDGSAANYAASSGVLFTAVSGQHLEGLRLLLRAREVIFAPAPPARSILEIAGHVFWLLDPRLQSLRDRAARTFLARLQDGTRRKTAALAVNHPQSPIFGGEVSDFRRRTIPSYFYASEIAPGPRGTIKLRGQSYPGLEEALGYIGEASEVPWNTSGMYAYLSNSSHPTLHVITDSLDVVGGKITGFGLEDVTLPYRIARMAIMCFVRCWQITAAYHGLDQREAVELGEEVDTLPEP
ncbi:hypothetical protein [Kribbella sp. NPDC049584]|uniref:hypothetical protein n=1 Tax=Kribbella sp. NPDC049584 TaxID=3154833 RepID=UPI003423D618